MRTTKEQQKEMAELYNKGMTLKQIGDKYTISIGSVRYILIIQNVVRRKAGSPKGSKNEKKAKIPYTEIPKIIERYSSTKDTLATIAKDYNVTKQCIDDLLRRHNVQKRKAKLVIEKLPNDGIIEA